MRTAKEWAMDTDVSDPKTDLLEFIQRIQRDAWRQGMADASVVAWDAKYPDGTFAAYFILDVKDSKPSI